MARDSGISSGLAGLLLCPQAKTVDRFILSIGAFYTDEHAFLTEDQHEVCNLPLLAMGLVGRLTEHEVIQEEHRAEARDEPLDVVTSLFGCGHRFPHLC